MCKRLEAGLEDHFQQENDPKQTAKAVRFKHVNVLEWPSQSEDQSQISVWDKKWKFMCTHALTHQDIF